MADQMVSPQSMKPSIRPSVQPTTNQLINQSINHSFWARSFFRSVVCSSCSFPPSFLPSFNWEPRCPCFAGAVEFLLSVRVQLLLQRKEHQSINQSINQSFVLVLGSFDLSVGILFVFLPSFIYSFNWCQYILALQEQLNSSFQ